jgi:hypothetical protein
MERTILHTHSFSQEYISADADAHVLKAVGLYDQDWHFSAEAYYDLAEIDRFAPGKLSEVVYVNPLHVWYDILQVLDNAGLDRENILKIKMPNGRFILKKYLPRNTGN